MSACIVRLVVNTSPLIHLMKSSLDPFPWAYLNRLFAHLPVAKTPATIAALLPHNLKFGDLRREGVIR